MNTVFTKVFIVLLFKYLLFVEKLNNLFEYPNIVDF